MNIILCIVLLIPLLLIILLAVLTMITKRKFELGKAEWLEKMLKICVWGLLGIFVDIIFLTILSFPIFWIGGWLDGIPFGLIASIPGLIIGGLIGVVTSVWGIEQSHKDEKSYFWGSVIGGLIGAILLRSVFINVLFGFSLNRLFN